MDGNENDIHIDDFDAGAQVKRLLRAAKESRFRLFMFSTFGLLIGAAISVFVPDTYEAQALLLLRERELIDNSELLRSIREDKTLAQREQTLAQELRSYVWVNAVLTKLQWADFLSLDQADKHEFVDRVRDPKNFEVSMNTDNAGDLLVQLVFRWNDPVKTAEYVQETYQHWISSRGADNLAYYRGEYEKAAAVLRDTESEHEKARVDLEEFRLREGFIDELSDTTSEVQIYLSLKLESNSLEAEVGELSEQIRELEQQLLTTRPSTTTAGGPRIANPDYEKLLGGVRIATQQVLILRAQKKEAHPEVIRAEKILAEAQKALNGFSGEQYLEQESEVKANDLYAQLNSKLSLAKSEYRGKLERKKKVAEQLENVDKQLSRRKTVELEFKALQNEYELTQKGLNQARLDIAPLQNKLRILESGPKGFFLDSRDSVEDSLAFSVLEDPIVPKKTVGLPKAIFPVAGLVVALGLGLASVLLGQLARSTYYDAREVQRSLSIPILGQVGHIATVSELRRRRLSAFASTLGSLLFVGSLGYFVYLVAVVPEQLPLGLQDAILELKNSLR